MPLPIIVKVKVGRECKQNDFSLLILCDFMVCNMGYYFSFDQMHYQAHMVL